jgi:CRP/FNR family cyclic AMP-dependent transcriptional regulator
MAVLRRRKEEEEYQSFRAGALIIKEGEPGDVMYIVKEGTVEVRVGSRVMETVEPGGIVGEIALIDAKARSASVVAKTDCRLLPVDEEQFVLLVQKMPYFALQVMRVLADRLRRTTTQHRLPQRRAVQKEVRKKSRPDKSVR